MSSIITLIDALELGPEDFADRGKSYGAEESLPVRLSAAWSREIDKGGLSKYRETRLRVGKYKFSKRTAAFELYPATGFARNHRLPQVCAQLRTTTVQYVCAWTKKSISCKL